MDITIRNNDLSLAKGRASEKFRPLPFYPYPQYTSIALATKPVVPFPAA